MNDQIRDLNITQIIPGNNDRTSFDPDKLAELATSIREQGLIQPITVRPALLCPCCEFVTAESLIHCPDCDSDELDDVYQIVAGERRFRASSLAKLDTIRVIVRTMTDEAAAIAMLAENVARDDLDPMDEARAYQTRITQFGWTVADCAKHAGVSTVRVRFRTKLLSLRDDIQRLVRDGHLSLGYAQILSDGDLDNNRQLIAIRKLRESASPTPAWYRRIVGELVAEQSQDSLFSLEFFTVQTLDDIRPIETAEPPSPTATTAPVIGATATEVLHSQAAFWTAAAGDWDLLGKSFRRNECLAAAALEQAVDALGSL